MRNWQGCRHFGPIVADEAMTSVLLRTPKDWLRKLHGIETNFSNFCYCLRFKVNVSHFLTLGQHTQHFLLSYRDWAAQYVNNIDKSGKNCVTVEW